MLIKVDPSAAEPVYIQIVNQIKHAVAAGSLVNGDRLPSIRSLARELRINPNTVIHAYRELEIENVVVSKRGQGSFITEAFPVMSLENRTSILAKKVNRMLVEAYHLGLTEEQVFEVVRMQLKKQPLGRKGKELPNNDE